MVKVSFNYSTIYAWREREAHERVVKGRSITGALGRVMKGNVSMETRRGL